MGKGLHFPKIFIYSHYRVILIDMIQTKTMAVVLLMSIAIIGTIGASQAAFADGNQCASGVCPGNAGAPGQNFGNTFNNNPSGGVLPPGQQPGNPTTPGG